MNVALSRSFRKDAVTLTEHPSIPFDNEDDSLLFEKLQEHVLAHYPNPERKGCPDPAVLKSLIDNPSDVTLGGTQRSAHLQVRGMYAPADGTA
jgi:hypothetical protein